MLEVTDGTSTAATAAFAAETERVPRAGLRPPASAHRGLTAPKGKGREEDSEAQRSGGDSGRKSHVPKERVLSAGTMLGVTGIISQSHLQLAGRELLL